MPVEMEEEKKKPAVQQPQLATVTPRPVLTLQEQREVQQFEQQERALMSQQREAGMQHQAKRSGEKAFFAEFKRGVETVGLLIQNEKAAAQFPQVTEDAVKSIIGDAQADIPAYTRGISAIAMQRKAEITDQAGESAKSIRTEYETRLQAILPGSAELIQRLQGTVFSANMAADRGPEAQRQVAELNQWRAGAMADLVAWREGEVKKVDGWKAQSLAMPKGEIELECLTRKVMDFYSLQGEGRARLEPTIREAIRETRSTANQAYRSELESTYNQLRKEAPQTEG